MAKGGGVIDGFLFGAVANIVVGVALSFVLGSFLRGKV